MSKSTGSDMTEEKDQIILRQWSVKEKKILLNCLKEHGSENISKIKSCLPDKSENAIARMIKKYQAIAELEKKDIYSPLDVWLRSGIFNEEDKMLIEALLYIYIFEDHPPPDETGGFDIKLAYKCLYDAAKGHATTELQPRTVQMLRDLIITVDKEVWPASEVNIIDYLFSKICNEESYKCYKRKRMD